ncbi:MAG: DNA internalization-related competence protein ComEC/Rec2 [Thermodesulfobacteriota bacterium]
MFRRPLVPVLVAFLAGILTGHLYMSHGPHPAPPSPALLLASGAVLLWVFLVFFHRTSVLILLLFFTTGFMLDLRGHRPSALAPLALQGLEVTMEATLLAPVRFTRDTARLEVRADRVAWKGEERAPGERVLVVIYSHPRKFSPGDRILLPARLRPFRNFNNPGGYDHEAAMAFRGIACSASVSDGRGMVPLGRGSLGFPLQMLEGLRSPLRDLFHTCSFPRHQALFRALILGEEQDIDRELRDRFAATGLGHVLAVSGLNVGMVAWVAFALLVRLFSFSYRLVLSGNLRSLTALVTCLPVVVYSLLAGFQVSCQRAMIMVLAYLLSIVLDREKEVWSTLSLAALVVLAVDPHEIFSVSFQLSFGAVIGLLWLTPRISGKLGPLVDARLGRGTPAAWSVHNLIGMVGATLSATLFLLPLIVYYFHRISLVTLPANLIVLPIIGLWVLPLGLLASAALVFSAPLAAALLKMGAWGLDLVIIFTDFWAGLPWAEVWVVRPNLFELGVLYGIWTCLLFMGRGRWAGVGLAGLLLVLASDVGYWVHRTCFHPDLTVTFLDVGQGNSALVQFPGRERMLIDGGGSMRGDFDVGRMVVAPSLLSMKIGRIDYLVLSHPDSDHMDGLLHIASRFNPREFWYNGDRAESEVFQALIETVRRGGMIERLPPDLKEGRQIAGARIDVLHPETGEPPVGSSGRPLLWNNRSLVLKISYEGNTFLFPGDLEAEGEEAVLSRRRPHLRSDVLLVSHHGSRRSSSISFLQQVKPRFSVISARGTSPARLPHFETLERLEGIGSRVLRIDRLGAITFTASKDRMNIRSHLGGWVENGGREEPQR